MSLVIPEGFGLAAFVHTGAVGTQPYVTTMGVSLASAEDEYVLAADALFLAYSAAFTAETSSVLTLDRVTLSVGSSGGGGSVDSQVAPVAGTRGGTFPPTALSAILRKSTNVLGRAGRGRMFMPGVLSEADVDQDGTVVAARRTALNTAATTFMTQLITGQSDPFVYPPTPPVLLHSSPTLAPTPIIGLTTSDLVGWIRGRIR